MADDLRSASDLPVSLKRLLRKRRRRRRRRWWKRTANGLLIFGCVVLVLAFCSLLGGYSGEYGNGGVETGQRLSTWGWVIVASGVLCHIVRACMPSGDHDDVADREIREHEGRK